MYNIKRINVKKFTVSLYLLENSGPATYTVFSLQIKLSPLTRRKLLD